MFKFGFSDPDKDDQPQDEKKEVEEELVWRNAEEIPLFKTPFGGNATDKANMVICGANFEIGLVIIPEEKLRATGLIQEVERSHSDLLPAKYEGGLKVWECTHDIGEFIDDSEEIQEKLKGQLVLDLGCGCGVLGLIALECGASVDFQDYNKEVIELVTIPNVCLNADEEDKDISTEKCRFYSGDWEKFSQLIGEERKYDLILTSETIYNPSNYNKLAEFFLKHLSADGYVLLGAKGYYFGVGGSTVEFQRRLKENYPGLYCESVWKNDSGVKREILKIKLAKEDSK